MSNSALTKIKNQTPVTVIVHGGSRIGYLITKTLIEQGSHVIIIDRFNAQTRGYITELKKSKNVDFFEFKGMEALFKNLKRFDYLFYLLNEHLSQKDFDSKEFLRETGYLDLTLKNARKNNAKFSLITSLALNRELSNRVNNSKVASPSPYSNIELQKYCETLAAEFKDKTNLNIRILRIGNLLGKGIGRVDNDTLHNLLKDSTEKPQITIKGEGLDLHNVINENDATYGILKLTFSDKTKGEVITLANKNNYTTLSIAYKLLELNTEAQSIKFTESENTEFVIQDLYVPAPHASKYGWIQQVTLEDSLVDQVQTYYDSINKKWDVEGKEKADKKEKGNVKIYKTSLGNFVSKLLTPLKNIFAKRDFDSSQISKYIGISALTIIFTYFVIYPIIGTLIGLTIISSSAKTLSDSLLDLETTKAKKEIAVLDRNIDRVSRTLSSLKWVFQITGGADLYNNSVELIVGAQYAADGASGLLDSIEPLASYIKDFQPAVDIQGSLPSTSREYREYLVKIEENQYKIDDAAYKISLSNDIVNSISTSVFPKFLQGRILELKSLTEKLDSATTDYKEIITFLPDLLGVDERKRYLILLQNESEIRSTGGWLTSYGVVGIEGGQVRELFVDDIYNADGTLKVQGKTFTAPKSMNQALGLKTWNFSLVNWYPDLTETYLNAEPFIRTLGKGDDLDGIITIDITFVQKLLSKWGGIEVPGETELVTSDNLYDKIFKLHENFTPGTTQKTTFLANLANEIIQKLLSKNIADLISLSDVFGESLDEKHLQASFKNRDAFNFFNSRAWADSLDSKYNEAPIAIDWNWGANKANLYLEKNYNLQVDIKDINTVVFKYTIATENTSENLVYPQGNYVNYQRVYIPSYATVTSVKGMDNNKYTTYKESGFKVLGGWFNTKIKDVNTLEITYQLKRTSENASFPIVKNGDNIFLTIDLFKQPGEKSHAYKLDIIYPSSWNIEDGDNLNAIQNQLSSRFELNKDTNFDIVWREAN